MGIYYLENIPWMWFMTFCALFILKNWAVVWGGERNYLVSILLNNQMDNYKLIQYTDNKILFFIVTKITILPSTLYVIVLLYLRYLILMWPMSSKYVVLSICLLNRLTLLIITFIYWKIEMTWLIVLPWSICFWHY